ncbi:MAG: LPS-assembly protein LptD [Methylococcales bacterium]|nr:LPS-assembly protein LptD [Methylococcales bacterium]
MHCRLFFVFLLMLFAPYSKADSDVWGCSKSADGEWGCATQAPVAKEENIKIKPVQASQPTVNSATAIPSKAKATGIQPSEKESNPTGWACSSKVDGETWNCNLNGFDPKGKARVMDDSEYSMSLLPPAFDYDQEFVFESLQSRLKYNPWENCTSAVRTARPYIASKDLRDDAPMDVRADYSEVFDKEITSFFGNVVITRADQTIVSDQASYDSISQSMDAQGHVFYTENDLSMYSDSTLLNLGNTEARLRKALFISPSGPIRGSSDVIYRDNKFLSRYKRVAFTSCPPNNQDWIIHAKRLKMNKQTGKAAVKHAWLEFKGLPVLYTPYLSFPLDDRRMSGFLPLTMGSTDQNGFDTVIPYYWNMAPNYDLTVWPRYMSKRGGMLGGEFRYLAKKSSGSIGAEYLPYDVLKKEARYSGTFKNNSQYTANLNSHVDLNYVSDEDYFDELNNALGLSNSRFLKSSADLNYNVEGINFRTHLETYQTIDKNVADSSKPYYKLPEVNLNLNHSFDEFPVDLAMKNEYINFIRKGRVSGQRVNLRPSITIPFETASGFFKPKVSLQHTQYFLSDQAVGVSSQITRTVPVFSADTGLFFEKEFEKFSHTIEPRAFYLYIPEKDQSGIPVFDTSLYDFNFSSLFRENRFSGNDRVQDAQQVSAALTTRLIDSETGQERLNLSVGEIFYFKDRNVTLLGGQPETNSMSNLVAELRAQLTDHLSLSAGIQWNPDINDISRGQGEIRYESEHKRILNLGYRYRRDNHDVAASIIQTDASFKWPIYNNWNAVGRWQYSLKFNSTKESFLGLEKESCCWRFRVIWRRFANTLTDSVDAKMDQGIFVQLELKGLASFGDKVDDFLEKNLKGYQRAE